MDIRRLLHNPDDGGWFVIGETHGEADMIEFRRGIKRNAIINTHLVNCTMNHENDEVANAEHKMKVQWTKCTSALCHPRTDDSPRSYSKRRICPVQLRMSTCQLTFQGVICQAYQHLSDEHDSAEPVQSSVTEDMKTHIIRMLQYNPDVKPMIIYKELQKLRRQGEFGEDLMPTKIQLRNALTYLRSRKLRIPSISKRQRDDGMSSDGSASPPTEDYRYPE